MNRDQLISQVKSEYMRLSDMATRGHIKNQYYYGMTPEAFYEQTLEKPIRDISAGKFDDCVSGMQVVERVANHKTKLERIQDNIESTLYNIEVAEEMIGFETDIKRIRELSEQNKQRAEAIYQMIRDLKEEQAREDLQSNSPNVIGGNSNVQ